MDDEDPGFTTEYLGSGGIVWRYSSSVHNVEATTIRYINQLIPGGWESGTTTKSAVSLLFPRPEIGQSTSNG